MKEATNPVRAVETSIRVLDAIQDLEEPTLARLSDQLDISKGAVHNHVCTLAEHGFVVHRDGQYRLGIRFFEYGEQVKRDKTIYDVGVPEVDKLAEETGELGNLLIEENGQGVYLYRTQGEQALTLDTGVGSRVYLHSTALGKAILAYLPESYVRDIIDRHGLPPMTENTITDPDDLFEELEAIRDRGYARDEGERASGVRCVASPVIRAEDEVLGAVSVAGPTSRMQGDRFQSSIPDLVMRAADVIGINATYV